MPPWLAWTGRHTPPRGCGPGLLSATKEGGDGRGDDKADREGLEPATSWLAVVEAMERALKLRVWWCECWGLRDGGGGLAGDGGGGLEGWLAWDARPTEVSAQGGQDSEAALAPPAAGGSGWRLG
jgi:hypothetical protein